MMTHPLTSDSPAVRLFAAMSLCSPEQIIAALEYNANRITARWLPRLAAESARIEQIWRNPPADDESGKWAKDLEQLARKLGFTIIPVQPARRGEKR